MSPIPSTFTSLGLFIKAVAEKKRRELQQEKIDRLSPIEQSGNQKKHSDKDNSKSNSGKE